LAEERFGYFMHDGTTPHAAKEMIRAFRGVFGEINGEDRSPDRNPCDFYLWGKLRSVLHANNFHDVEALIQNIREEMYNI
jgi:hypothetical protein